MKDSNRNTDIRWREARKFKDIIAGVNYDKVAKFLGCHRESVNHWANNMRRINQSIFNELNSKGFEALKKNNEADKNHHKKKSLERTIKKRRIAQRKLYRKNKNEQR